MRGLDDRMENTVSTAIINSKIKIVKQHQQTFQFGGINQALNVLVSTAKLSNNCLFQIACLLCLLIKLQ